MKADLQYFLNDCSTCLAQQEKNKKLPKIPEVEVREPFEQLTMDIGKTPAGEHILAVTDRFTGYVWASKTGDRGTGTSAKCIEILKSHIGTGLLTTKSIKSDEGTNLISAEMQEFLDDRGIASITSSAYHPAGNLLAETGIRRVKRAIGREKMEHAWDHIQALNYSSPYSNEIRSPFEAMYKFSPKHIGIPKPEFLRNGTETKRKNHKEARNIDNYGCNQWESRNLDKDKITMKERLIDDFWEEKIHDRKVNTQLYPGENIYYRDPTIKGFGRWKPGVILDRKGEEEINGRLIKLKGYDILDTVTGKHTTRTREDIRVKKKSKMEDKIYKEYVEFLNKMHRANNDRAEGEEYKKPIFKESYRKNNTEIQQTPQEIKDTEPTKTNQTQPEKVTIIQETQTNPPDE